MLRNLEFKISQKGFTLIELMIVVAILGILVAIAMPSFAAYRLKGLNASAHSDIRNLITFEAAFFSDWDRFAISEAAAVGAGSGGTGAGALLTGPSGTNNAIITATARGAPRDLQIALGNGINLVASTGGADDSSYTCIAKHIMGNTAYGVDSDSAAVYADITTWPSGTAIAAGNEPASTPGDDFTGVGNWDAK
jgi:prepilin-type N-terminal cleavage/methylation domain-containing protein